MHYRIHQDWFSSRDDRKRVFSNKSQATVRDVYNDSPGFKGDI